jgi:hypothetical protein
MTDVRLEGITVLAEDVQALADFFDGCRTGERQTDRRSPQFGGAARADEGVSRIRVRKFGVPWFVGESD